MRLFRRRFPLPAFSLLVLGLLAGTPTELLAQSVHTVGGAGDFGTIGAAVTAAAEGDIILVADGYLAFEKIVVDGKSLTILADGQATVSIIPVFFTAPTLEIRNLGPGQSVVVRGLDVTTGDTDPETAVAVTNCAGPVLFEECSLMPRNGIGLHVTDSASVTARDCTLSGGFGEFPVTGLRVDDSSVFLHACSVLGGDGQGADEIVFPHQLFVNGDGGDGARVFGDSELFVSGGQLLGGSGGPTNGFCFVGGDAGHGLVVGGGVDAPLVRTRDVTIDPGVATSGGCGQPAGSSGSAVVVVSGSHDPLPGTSRDMWMTAPVVVGDDVTLSFRGQPGDQVLLFYSPALMPGLFVPGRSLVIHVAIPFLLLPVSPLPGTGALDLTLTVPSVPPGVEGATLSAQALFVNGGDWSMGGPSHGVFLAP